MPPKTTKTFCRICVAFCGLDVETDGSRITRVRPDKDNPFNWRDFCLKGGSSNNIRDHEKRLTTPMKRVGDHYVPVTYQQAIKEISGSLNKIRRQHGAQAIATYSGNPGMMNTTSAMFQAGFLAGLKNTNNYSAVSVDTSNLHLVSQEMYGCELALLIPDVDHAKCFLLIGTNPAVSTMGWLTNVPDGWGRLLAAQTNGADLIVVDPRRTATTNKANTHLLVQPGEDWALLLGLIKVIFANGWEHREDCEQATGIEQIKAIAAEVSLANLAERCGIAVNDIKNVAERFAKAETGFCLAHTGVAHNRNGTLGEWLSHVLNLVTGRIDRPGGRYYNPGIFKNTMEFLNKQPSRTASPSRIGGFRPIYNCYPMATMADEILTPGNDQIRALIIDGGNPVVSGPDGAKLDKALQTLDLLIAIDLFQRESHQHADWLIPGSHFLEREELTSMIGPLFELPYIQLGQAAIEPIAGVKPEWEFYRDLTLHMRLPFMGSWVMNGLIYVSRCLARLTKNKKLAFNPRWLWFLTIKSLSKIKWRDLVTKPSGFFYAKKSYGHFRPALQTDNGKIHAAPDMFVNALKTRIATPSCSNNPEYPFFLVNQRRKSMMNSWLVETVKRKDVYGEYIEISAEDASAMAVANNELLQVESKTNALIAKVRISTEVPQGIVSMDHGWGSRLFDPQNNSQSESQGVNRNLLIASDKLDELTGMPNLNGSRVNLSKVDIA
jgi:formate dehydrogenase